MALTELFRELEVLKRAVRYPNLSGAANNIGLSQPQLSRIIKRIEEEFKVQLLDRAVKRKSAWTPFALQLAEAVGRVETNLRAEIQSLHQAMEIRTLRIGTLEGLAERAARASVRLYDMDSVQSIHLSVFDLNDLEARFLRGDLDILLTLREPSRKKYENSAIIGYQKLDRVGQGEYEVLSEFEFLNLPARENKKGRKRLISNSLIARRYWIESGLGKGRLPFPSTKATGESITIYLIAQDGFPTELWKRCVSLARAEQKNG